VIECSNKQKIKIKQNKSTEEKDIFFISDVLDGSKLPNRKN
jgi:hypothetical protein